MLIPCPECQRPVSDRAHACPGCGFPVAEALHPQAPEIASPDIPRSRPQAVPSEPRIRIGEVDCPKCQARGFVLHSRKADPSDPNSSITEHFDWCEYCEHTGRQVLVESEEGFFAVPRVHVEDFLNHNIDPDHPAITLVGTELPDAHRYAEAGPSYGQAE